MLATYERKSRQIQGPSTDSNLQRLLVEGLEEVRLAAHLLRPVHASEFVRGLLILY